MALNPIIKFTTLFGLLAVELAVSIVAAQGSTTLTLILSVVFLLISMYLLATSVPDADRSSNGVMIAVLFGLALLLVCPATPQTAPGKEAVTLRDQAARLLASGDARRQPPSTHARSISASRTPPSISAVQRPGRSSANGRRRSTTTRPLFACGWICPSLIRSAATLTHGSDDSQDAIDDYNQAVQIKRDYWDAYVARADANGSSGRWERALADLDYVLERAPGHARALALRGGAGPPYANDDRAVEDYTAALARSPRDRTLLLARPPHSPDLGKHAEAFADRDAAVQLDPSDAAGYIIRGGSHHQLGRHSEGLADRARAIEIDNHNATAWLARGNAHFLLGNWEFAIADLQGRPLRFDPRNVEAPPLIERARAELARAKAPPAPEPKPHEPSQAADAHLSGSFRTQRNLRDGACQPLRHLPGDCAAPCPGASRRAPPPAPPSKAKPPAAPTPSRATAEPHHRTGRLLLQQGKYEQAIQALSEAIRRNPDHALAYNARGYAHLRLHEPKEALADFDQAIEKNPRYANAYQNRASARLLLGDKEGSEQDAAKARSLLQ